MMVTFNKNMKSFGRILMPNKIVSVLDSIQAIEDRYIIISNNIDRIISELDHLLANMETKIKIIAENVNQIK